jgi:hypothetical protein
MTEFGLFRQQVATVALIRGHLDGHALDDFQSVAFEADHFLGAIGQQSDLSNSQIV